MLPKVWIYQKTSNNYYESLLWSLNKIAETKQNKGMVQKSEKSIKIDDQK